MVDKRVMVHLTKELHRLAGNGMSVRVLFVAQCILLKALNLERAMACFQHA